VRFILNFRRVSHHKKMSALWDWIFGTPSYNGLRFAKSLNQDRSSPSERHSGVEAYYQLEKKVNSPCCDISPEDIRKLVNNISPGLSQVDVIWNMIATLSFEKVINKLEYCENVPVSYVKHQSGWFVKSDNN